MLRNNVQKGKEKSYSDNDLCEGVLVVKEERKPVCQAANPGNVPVETSGPPLHDVRSMPVCHDTGIISFVFNPAVYTVLIAYRH